MDPLTLLTVIGSISGIVALLGLAAMFGVYRERVDRHERLLNLLVEESLALSWRQGRLRGLGNPEMGVATQVLSLLPPDVHDCCREIGRGKAGRDIGTGSRIVRKLGVERIVEVARTLDATPLETLGVLVVYAMSFAGDS